MLLLDNSTGVFCKEQTINLVLLPKLATYCCSFVHLSLMGGENRLYSMHTSLFFYFVNCVIISCKLSFNSRFSHNQIPIMSFLGFKKAELGCKMSELRLYV